MNREGVATKTASKIPKLLRDLPLHGDLPVPHTVKWIDGKPDFRQLDQAKWEQCVAYKLCGICGKALGEWVFYIGGENSAENGLFIDSGMHRNCVVESIRLCPYLLGQREYRGDLPAHPNQLATGGRPKVMYMLRGKTKDMRLVRMSGALAIDARGQETPPFLFERQRR